MLSRSGLPDKIDDVLGHHFRLLELQEVPGVLDYKGVTAWRENPLDPRYVIRCHAPVVVAVEVKRRQHRWFRPPPM